MNETATQDSPPDDGMIHLLHLVDYLYPNDLPGRPKIGDREVHTWMTQIGSQRRDIHYLEKTLVFLCCFDCPEVIGIFLEAEGGRLLYGDNRCSVCRALMEIEAGREGFERRQAGDFAILYPNSDLPWTSAVFWASLQTSNSFT